MTDLVRFSKNQAKKLEDTLTRFPQKVEGAISAALFSIGNELAQDAGDMAPFLSGNLRRSITVLPQSIPQDHISVGTNLEYARIHDQGGTIKARTITPRNPSGFLRFQIGGKWVFTKKVRQPARTVQPWKGKGYLTPAFESQVNGRALATFLKEIDLILV
jgi:hypothetical protein